MPIKITNTLTGQRWTLPDPGGSDPLYLGPPMFPPGVYDIRNSSQNAIPVVINGSKQITVPDGDALLDHLPPTWSISNNENIYSSLQQGGDYLANMTPSAHRGMPGTAGAPPLLDAWMVLP